MEVVIKETYEDMSRESAQMVLRSLRKKPNLALGLATGSTPVGFYKELIKLYQNHEADFSRVTTFNLDEYVGLLPNHNQSYHYFMFENLFNHINIPRSNINVPNGVAMDVSAFCEWYENEIKRVGGIDIQILGIGSDGHIGFNEPGSSLGSRTRIKTLTRQTIDDNARFFSKPDDVPNMAITMGVGTIMEAKEIIMLANSEKKAKIIAQCIEGPISAEVTGSILQMHPKVTVILDKPASTALKRKDYYTWVYENRKKVNMGGV